MLRGLRPLSLPRQYARRPWTAAALYRPVVPSLRVAQTSIRYASETGEGKTGHLNETSNQAIFYFDNVYPLRLTWLFALPWQAERRLEGVMDKATNPHALRTNPLHILRTMPGKKIAEPTEMEAGESGTSAGLKHEDDTEVYPRLKEGGAFVKVTLPAGESATELEDILSKHLRESQFKPWWNPFQRMRARLVKGKPWVEDLYRMPSSRLKVQFLPGEAGTPAVELGQEALYEFFRPYGKLADISAQPTDSKELPRYAIIDYLSVRRSAMAKNCLHGVLVPESHGGGKVGTLLKIGYEQKMKHNWIKDWIFSHPRIFIPILAAIVAAISIAVFDPIRTFFIKTHITHWFHFGNWSWLKSAISSTTDFLKLRKKKDDAGLDVIWDDRRGLIEQIQTFLMESSDTFIIVQGPRGSGKKELVADEALKHRAKLVIDCKPIQEARGDSPTICAAANQVGYMPVFSWMNTVSGWIDLAVQGTTGVKSGFSETLETQIVKILNNTAAALKEVGLEGRKKSDNDANLTEDEYLEAHPEKRVVVVIDNFLHKSSESQGTLIYDKLAEWAAELTSANLAHVIFLTHDVSYTKTLNKALPDRVFRQIALSDSSPEAAKRFVISRLDADGELSDDPDNPEKKMTASQRRTDLVELDSVIEIVGGRLTDLEFLARRIKTGETPYKAVREIVEQSASEILKMYLLSPDESASGKRRWNPTQAWLLIKQLAESKNASLRYNEVVLDDTFKASATGGPDAVLQALEQAELINIVVSPNGRPQSIKPGKPVYHAAFQRLTEDKVLQSRLDLAIAADLIKVETGTIDKCESELKLLGELPKQPYELTPRVRWLLSKIAASQAKVEKYESDSAALKSVLQSEF